MKGLGPLGPFWPGQTDVQYALALYISSYICQQVAPQLLNLLKVSSFCLFFVFHNEILTHFMQFKKDDLLIK